jgi:hypothetical protein
MERAKDNLNNVGWAGEMSMHCCSCGNGVLRMTELPKAPASHRFCLFPTRKLGASVPSLLGLEEVRSTLVTEGTDFACRGLLSLVRKKNGKMKKED